MNIFDLLNQREIWQDGRGRTVRLEDMSCTYKANCRNFFLRRAESVAQRAAFALAMMDAEYGDEVWYVQSSLDPTCPVGHDATVDRLGAEQWLRETPLMRELLYQSRAASYDGPLA